MRRNCLVLAALLVLLFVSAVPAQAESASYYDPVTDTTQTNTSVTNLTSTFQMALLGGKLKTGWYAVGKSFDYGTIAIDGDVHLILKDGRTLTANGGIVGPGIKVTGKGKLTIYGESKDSGSSGTAKLIAKSSISTGIGGTIGSTASPIVINGGRVEATAAGALNTSAGIGGGGTGVGNAPGHGGNITINHGVVIATGGPAGGAGIGGGGGTALRTGGNGGIIDIAGGTVTAKGGTGAAGIGGGAYRGASGTILISKAADVTANGGKADSNGVAGGAGIGGGGGDRSGTTTLGGAVNPSITIDGNLAKVKAAGGAAVGGNNARAAGANVGTGGNRGNRGKEALRAAVITAGTPVIGGTLQIGFAADAPVLTRTNGPAYQWQHSSDDQTWSNISGATAAELSLTVSASTPGYYRCIVNSFTGGYGIVSTSVRVQKVQQATPVIGINYGDETLTGFANGATYKVTWGIDGENDDVTTATGVIDIEGEWFGETLWIIEKGNGNDIEDSEACELPVPDRPAAPAGLGVFHANRQPGATGRIVGTTDEMEYKDSEDGWESCPDGEIKDLVAGKYVVRSKANANALPPVFASEAETLTINQSALKVDMPTFAAAVRGYAQPDKMGIGITNQGSGPVTLQGVAMYPTTDDTFVFPQRTGTPTLAAGKSSADWATVQPKAGLAVGTHTGIVVVSYLVGGNTEKVEAKVTFTVNNPSPPPPGPSRSLPVLDPNTSTIGLDASGNLDGALGISGLSGSKLPLVIEIRDKDGKEPALLKIEDIEGALDANGKLIFEVPADKLKNLPIGDYTVYISSPGNGSNWSFLAKKIGSFSNQPLGNWSVPATLTAASKVSYNLVALSGTGQNPILTVKVDNTDAVKVDATTLKLVGTLQVYPKSNVANVTFTDQRGTSKTCVVTVVANEYERRAPLRIKKKLGVYTSTNALYYDGENLEVGVFLLNKRKYQPIKYAGDLTLRLYKGNTEIYSKNLSRWKMRSTLRYNDYAVYQITLTPDDLKGAKIQGPYELIHGEYQAVLTRRANVTPVIREGRNVVDEENGQAKAKLAMIVKASEGSDD